MYHSIIPVTEDHDPIVIEGQIETQLLLSNAGPAPVEVQVWINWKGKVNGKYSENSSEPNLLMELRPGNQKIVAGSFVRIAIKDAAKDEYNFIKTGAVVPPFAAVGSRVLSVRPLE